MHKQADEQIPIGDKSIREKNNNFCRNDQLSHGTEQTSE